MNVAQTNLPTPNVTNVLPSDIPHQTKQLAWVQSTQPDKPNSLPLRPVHQLYPIPGPIGGIERFLNFVIPDLFASLHSSSPPLACPQLPTAPSFKQQDLSPLSRKSKEKQNEYRPDLRSNLHETTSIAYKPKSYADKHHLDLPTSISRNRHLPSISNDILVRTFQ